MAHQISCPACQKPLYLPNEENTDDNNLEVICAACLRKYWVSYLEVSFFSFYLNLLSPSKEGQTHQYRRVYQLRGRDRRGTLQTLEFSPHQREETFSAAPGDQVILLHLGLKYPGAKLVEVINLSTGGICQVLSPRHRAKSVGLKAGLLALGTSAVLANLFGLSPSQLIAVTFPSGIGVGALVAQVQSRKGKERDPCKVAQLKTEQLFLQQLNLLNQNLERCDQSLASERQLIKRLQRLSQLMRQADAELYAFRLEVLSRGIAVLEKQLTLSHNLVEGYSQLKKLVEIEYESSRLAEQLPAAQELGSSIFQRLEELKALEQQKTELELLIEPTKFA